MKKMYEVDTSDLNLEFVAAIKKMGKSLDSNSAAQDRADAATTGELSQIYQALWGWGWTTHEIDSVENLLRSVLWARGEEYTEKFPKLPQRAERVVPIGGTGLYQIEATLTKRGWSPGEVRACRQFVHYIHFLNKEIVELHRQRNREKSEAAAAAKLAEQKTEKESKNVAQL